MDDSYEIPSKEQEGVYMELSSIHQNIYQQLLPNTDEGGDPPTANQENEQHQKNTTNELNQKLKAVRRCLAVSSIYSILPLMISLGAICLAIMSFQQTVEGHIYPKYHQVIQSDLTSLKEQVVILKDQLSSLQVYYNDIELNQLGRLEKDVMSVNNQLAIARANITEIINSQLNSSQSLLTGCYQYTKVCNTPRKIDTHLLQCITPFLRINISVRSDISADIIMFTFLHDYTGLLYTGYKV